MFPQIMSFIAPLLSIDRAVAGGARHQRGGLEKIVCCLFADGQMREKEKSFLRADLKCVKKNDIWWFTIIFCCV